MRRWLDALYLGAGIMAAASMLALLLAVVISILGRQFPVLNIIGIDAYAGYAMASCGFFGMAYTLRSGGHIRVVLLLEGIKRGRRRWLEMPALLVSVLLVGLLCFYSVEQVWQSYIYFDISINNDATPLWIPQSAMALGNVVFLVATIDQLVQAWNNRFWDGDKSEVSHGG